MGRPPLKVTPFLVRLTDEQRQRIEQAVGPNRMAAFIREAVDEKLEREEARPAGDSKADVLVGIEKRKGRLGGAACEGVGVDDLCHLSYLLNWYWEKASMFRLTMAALLISHLISAAHSNGINIRNVIDCGLWHEYRSSRRSAEYEWYLVGLLNGLSLGVGTDFWGAKGGVSPEQAYLWMDGYCRRDPLSDIVMGAIALFDERTDRAFAVRRD